ncbi:FliM/FliN family flagellar motor switch protein [Thermaurantiacus sp.]
MTPGRMAGKPTSSRTRRRQGLEISFDSDPLADLDSFSDKDGAESAARLAADLEGDRVGDSAAHPAAAGPSPDQLVTGAAAANGARPGDPTAAPASGAGLASADGPQPARQADPADAARALGIPLPLAKIEVTVSVEVGRTRLRLADLVSVAPGELVALDRMTNAPVDILVNGKLFARGEIVAIGERFGVRLTELVEPGDLP